MKTIEELQRLLDIIFQVTRLKVEKNHPNHVEGITVYSNEVVTKTVIDYIEEQGFRLRNIRCNSFEGLQLFFEVKRDVSMAQEELERSCI